MFSPNQFLHFYDQIAIGFDNSYILSEVKQIETINRRILD